MRGRSLGAGNRGENEVFKTLCRIAHVVAGIMTGIAVLAISEVIGIIAFLTFIFYELNEDWHLKDQAWIDVLEYAIGLYAVIAASAILYFM